MRQVSSADANQLDRGPVSPSAAAAVVHWPLVGQAACLDAGLLNDWQQRNRTLSLPLALRQLKAAGNLGNLRLAIVGKREGYRGPVFMDSDIYKTLEAVGWESSAGAVIRNWPPSPRKRRHCWRRLSSRMGT